jgi:DNA-binding GntR family transcriptional regulator
MARTRTPNLPDVSALLLPRNPLMLAVEEAVLRGTGGSPASVSIAEQIAARLAGAITLDRVHAGQRLLEKDLSEVLQVSRAPVREALRILERDRLVEFAPRRGAIVTAPDADELRDIFAVRSGLYCMLLERVMRDDPAALAEVFRIHVPRLGKAADEGVDAYALAGFLLNGDVFGLCRNRLLADMLKSISLRTLRYVRLGLAGAPQAIPQSLRTWRSLQRAAARHDAAQVLEVARGRMEDTRDAAVRALLSAPPARARVRSRGTLTPP